jgi:hypothetical protein
MLLPVPGESITVCYRFRLDCSSRTMAYQTRSCLFVDTRHRPSHCQVTNVHCYRGACAVGFKNKFERLQLKVSLCMESQMRRPTNISSHAALPSHGKTAFRGPGVRANCGLANRPSAFLRSLPRSHDAQWHVVVFTVTAKRDIVSIATTSRILSDNLTTTQLLNYYKTTQQPNDHESTGALKYLTTTSLSVYRSV